MDKAESFEVTEYGDNPGLLDRKHSVISEIVRDQVSRVPSANIRVAFSGNMVKLSYHCFELHLPSRIQRVLSDEDVMLKDMVKILKKEFKIRTGEVLKLKEMKDMANYSVQKVSLNERYMYVGWRWFELG